jgi:hypothetical protein
MKSASRSSSSFDPGFAPRLVMRAASPRALKARTVMPSARPISMTRAPILPVPKTPSVLPRHCTSCSRGHLPSRISRSMRGMRRAVASMSAIACSATANALTPGVLQMVTPRRPAAARSTLSTPVPQIETILSVGQAANTASVK